MTATPWLRRHPLLGYYAAAYAISWGGILIVVAANGFDVVHLRAMDTGIIFVAMLLGPSVTGLAMTAVLEGRAGLRRLKVSLMHWRVGVRWYALALLTTPVLLVSVLWSTSALVDAAFAPRFQWQLFAVGLVAGSFEEIGWTGFATKRLLARQRQFVAGLSLGLVWALWHMLVDFRQNFNPLGAGWLLEFSVVYVAALTAYRILMTWVYAHTQSLLLAVLMHASYTGWLFVLYPAAPDGQGMVWQATFAFGLWVVVAAVAAGNAHRWSRPPVRVEQSRDQQ